MTRYFELAHGSAAWKPSDASLDGYSSELDKCQSIRLSDTLEELLHQFDRRFPALKVTRSKLIKRLCLDANRSEVFFGGFCVDKFCANQWLRTAISFQDPEAVLSSRSPLSESAVLDLSTITIHSNVLPCHWTTLQTILDEVDNSEVTRYYFTSEIVETALREHMSLTEKLDEWRVAGHRCDLARQLKERRQNKEAPPANARRNFWEIEPSKLEPKGDVGSGGEGAVYRISWRKGIFARKAFIDKGTFTREFQIAEIISHPHIVHSFGVSNNGQEVSLLMELLDEDLSSFILEKTRLSCDKPPFSRIDSLDVLTQVAQAMEHLHLMKVVHLDLKSGNILISRFQIFGDDHFLVKVADFGQAEVVDSTSTFRESSGTTQYAAPEVLKNRKTKDGLMYPYKADVYSYGIVAYVVLTGLEPYANVRPRANIISGVIDGTLRPNLREHCSRPNFSYPPVLISLVERCWDFEPDNRPSFTDICKVLNEVQNSTIQNSVSNPHVEIVETNRATVSSHVERVETNGSMRISRKKRGRGKFFTLMLCVGTRESKER